MADVFGKAAPGAPPAAAPVDAAAAAAAFAGAAAAVVPPKVIPGEVVPDEGCEGATAPTFVSLVDWCAADALDNAGKMKAAAVDKEVWFLRNLFGFRKAAGGFLTTLPSWACAVFGNKPGYWAQVAIVFVYIWLYAGDILLSVIFPALCGQEKMAPLYLTSTAMGFAERWIGTDFGPARQSLNLSLNFNCPQTPQGPSETVPAYLHGLMSKNEATLWNSAFGWCPDKTSLAIDAARWRPSPIDIVTWDNWGCLSATTTVDIELSKLGMIKPDDRTNFVCASHTPLGVGEIYRLMHECRPGARPGRPVYTQDDAKRDLKRLGYNERDIPYMLYLARTPLSHRQLLQPYYEGSITSNVLRSYLLDDGFDDEDITRLMPFYDHNSAAYTAREIGSDTVAGATRAAAAGEIPPAQWAEIVKGWDVSPTLYAAAGQQVEFQRQLAIRKAAIADVKAGFNSGEIAGEDAQKALAMLGVDQKSAVDIVQEWELVSAAKFKPAGASQLCQWHGQGYLSTAEFAARLKALHYSNADITRIISVCVDAERRKVEAAAAKQAAKQEAAAQKEQTAEQKAAKEAQAATARANLAAARAKQALLRAEKAAASGGLAAAAKIGSHVKARESEMLTGKINPQPGPQPGEVAAPAVAPSALSAALIAPPL